MLFRYRNLLEKPSRLTIAIAVTGIGVAAAASAVAVTLPGGATAGATTATAYLHGAGVAPAEATPHSAVQLQAREIETARLAQQHAALKAMRAHEARLAARAAARRAARAAARRAARRAAHRAAVLAAQRQARAQRQAANAQQAPSTSPAPAQPSGAAPSGVWACIAQHESGGNPAENTGNGFYGLYQFTIGSWQAAGGPPGLPSNYSAAEQTAIAMRLQAMSGWGNWPVTSQECGV